MEYYDYPVRSDRKDIFSVSDDNYFLKGEKFSFLCNYTEAQEVDKRNMFLGSFVLVIYKRLAVIKKGEICYINKDFSDGDLSRGRYKDNGFVIICDTPKEYYIHSWKKNFLSYEVRDDSEYNKALKVTIFETPDEAVNKAKELSAADGNSYLVACWFDDFDRH